MSLVDKIPPLVSALAFGYGVGMAAPDGALDRMHVASVALVASHDGLAKTRRAAVEPIDPALDKKLPGKESEMLAQLRSAHTASRYADDRGDSCSMREPSQQFSRMPRQGSQIVQDDDMAEEGDEFDATETAAISKLQLPDLGLGVSRQTLKYVRFFTKTDRGRFE